MFNAEMRCPVPLETSRLDRRMDHAKNQAVISKPSGRRLRKCECQMWNIQFSTAHRTEMSAVGNFRDWHAAVGNVPWSSVTKTPMNSHGKLVLHPLWNSQPLQIIMQQPRKAMLVFIGSSDHSRCSVLKSESVATCLCPSSVRTPGPSCNNRLVM